MYLYYKKSDNTIIFIILFIFHIKYFILFIRAHFDILLLKYLKFNINQMYF